MPLLHNCHYHMQFKAYNKLHTFEGMGWFVKPRWSQEWG